METREQLPSRRRGRPPRPLVWAGGIAAIALIAGLSSTLLADRSDGRAADPARGHMVKAKSGVDVVLRRRVVDLFEQTGIAVRGISARAVEVRLRGAIDASGVAYAW